MVKKYVVKGTIKFIVTANDEDEAIDSVIGQIHENAKHYFDIQEVKK